MKFKMKTLIFFVCFSLYVFAGGTDFRPLVGARTISLNGLYFAGIDGLSGTIINPASLGYLTDKAIEGRAVDRLGLSEFNSSKMGLYRSFRDDDFNFEGGLYWNLAPGFTVAASYGRVYDYYVNWPFAFLGADNSTILAFDMFNHFKIDAISPAASLKFGTITFGLAINFYDVSQEAAFPVRNNQSANGNGLFAYQFNYNQKAWTFGFNFGIDFDASDQLRIGAVVKSGFKASLKGDAQSNMFQAIDSTSNETNLSSDFEMPWIIGVGAVYNLAPDLYMNVDVSYHLYNSIQKSMNFKLEDQVWQNGLSHVDSISGFNPTSLPLNYKNQLDFGVGLELSMGDGTDLRVGYRYSQTPNSSETYSFLFPNVSQHSLSVGIGFKDGPYTLDAGLAYSFGISTKVQSNSFSRFSGTYNTNGYAPTITLRYQL